MDRVEVSKPVSRLRRLWWRVAGEPDLWAWPRRMEFPFEYDPHPVQRLKTRLDVIHVEEAGAEWLRDRLTGQVWRRTVTPWEFWDWEVLTPTVEKKESFTTPGEPQAQ